jgi:hypothetical protein
MTSKTVDLLTVPVPKYQALLIGQEDAPLAKKLKVWQAAQEQYTRLLEPVENALAELEAQRADLKQQDAQLRLEVSALEQARSVITWEQTVDQLVSAAGDVITRQWAVQSLLAAVDRQDRELNRRRSALNDYSAYVHRDMLQAQADDQRARTQEGKKEAERQEQYAKWRASQPANIRADLPARYQDYDLFTRQQDEARQRREQARRDQEAQQQRDDQAERENAVQRFIKQLTR